MNNNNPIKMIPVQTTPMDVGGRDLRPFAEAFAFYVTGNGKLDDVRDEVRHLIYGEDVPTTNR